MLSSIIWHPLFSITTRIYIVVNEPDYVRRLQISETITANFSDYNTDFFLIFKSQEATLYLSVHYYGCIWGNGISKIHYALYRCAHYSQENIDCDGLKVTANVVIGLKLKILARALGALALFYISISRSFVPGHYQGLGAELEPRARSLLFDQFLQGWSWSQSQKQSDKEE